MRLVSDDALAVITIFQEAAGESLEGKIAVAEVIRNRMATRYQSDGTVAGTVLRPFAFSGWNSTRDPNIAALRIRSVQVDSAATNDCAIAWHQSLGSHTVKGAVLYVNPAGVAVRPNWADPAKLLAVVGQHEFYGP